MRVLHPNPVISGIPAPDGGPQKVTVTPKVCLGCIRNKRDNQIRALLDPVKPEQVFPIFEEILQVLEQQGQLESFRLFADTLLMAMDGTEYFGSSQIHCPPCSTRQLKSAETYYFHSVVTPVIVCPGQFQVIPLVPEFVVPQDGHDKQDCENAAVKRWLLQYGQRYSALNVTVLGDDLYCHQPLCQPLLAQRVQLHFGLPSGVSSHPL